MMRRALLFVTLCLAALVAVMPPGVCGCWLMFDPGLHHPHPGGHPERPHTHDYVLDMFQSHGMAAAPPAHAPLALLLARLAAGGLRRKLAEAMTAGAGWLSAPLTPPPR